MPTPMLVVAAMLAAAMAAVPTVPRERRICGTWSLAPAPLRAIGAFKYWEVEVGGPGVLVMNGGMPRVQVAAPPVEGTAGGLDPDPVPGRGAVPGGPQIDDGSVDDAGFGPAGQ
jgi:hypothetical protein